MAYYYKINDFEAALPLHKGFHLQKVKKFKESGPKINYDFSKHVLIELLDETTPEAVLWSELGLVNNSNIIHKRIMFDSHRIKCRRAIVICINSEEAKQLALRISQTKVMNRSVCAIVIEDLLSDLCLFEKQIIQFGDNRSQQQLLYVSDLNRCRGSTGLVKFLKEKFSHFGTILSVLVCSDDDDGYAFPEGVIKFAYLSEAFAAELAFDQYVVGKERLSVTTHHNILLSQCDLRVRLRDAQWCNNPEYNNTSTESHFQSCDQTCEQNDFAICSEDPVVNSMNNLQVSNVSNNSVTSENNLIDDRSEDFIPAFSQYNFKMNIPKKHHYESTYAKKDAANREVENTVSLPYRNITSDLNSTGIIENIGISSKSSSLNHFNNHGMSIWSETKFTGVSSTKSINHIKDSHYHADSLTIHGGLLSHNKISSKSLSDTDSFITCKNSVDTSLNSPFPSLETTLHNSSQSHKVNREAKHETVDCKLLQKSPNDALNGSKVVKPFSGKKRKKKFLPSQKLCLKSQRTGLSQSDFQSTRSEISASSSSQPEKPLNKNEVVCKKGFSLSHISSDSSKVVDWLSTIPAPQSVTLFCEKEECMDIETNNEKPLQNNKKHNNRITIHRAPSIKSNVAIPFDDNSWSDDSCLENNDPNKIPVIIADESPPIPLIDKSKSPLQVWLKQEIMSSTNNRIVRSQETSKSVIVCATRTKDIIIAVGCSHMTCDPCYPESTDLLLGYN